MTKKKWINYDSLIKFLGSQKFLWLIIVFFMIQALWIAVSFRFPMLYDEAIHLSFIESYTNTLSPYTTDTPANMMTQISLSHYFESLVYRFLDFVGMSEKAIIISLRVINIGLVTGGLFIYAKLLRFSGVKQVYANLGILLFTLLPITPWVAATINYDNAMFPIVGLYLYFCLKSIRQKNASFVNLLTVLSIGLVASLVKYVFLPLFIGTMLVLIARHLKKHKTSTSINESIREVKKRPSLRWTLLLPLAVLSVMAIGMYGSNLVMYQSIHPSCYEVRTKEKCLENGVLARGAKDRETKYQRTPVTPDAYTKHWFNQMLRNTMWTGNNTVDSGKQAREPLSIMKLLLFVGVFFSMASVLYTWKTMRKSPELKFLVGAALFWVIVIFIVNIRIYYANLEAYAIQPRYLLIVLPILITLAIYSTALLTGKNRRLKLSLFLISIVLFTQGGGVITHIVQSDSSWYWNNETIIKMNQSVRDGISPLIKQ